MSTSGTDEQQDQTIEQAQAEAMLEIEGLIGEIEGIKDSLQEGGDSSGEEGGTSELAVGSETPEAPAEAAVDSLLEGVDQALQEAEGDHQTPGVLQADPLGGFRGGAEEPSLEDSVGSIEPEPPVEGGLLADPEPEERPVARVKPQREEKRSQKSRPSESHPSREHKPAAKKKVSSAPARLGEAGKRMDRQMEKRMRGASGGENPEGLLKMTMSGSLRLALVYEAEGRAVTVSFDDGFLRVELSDGSEFRIPLSRGGFSQDQDEDEEYEDRDEYEDDEDLAA